jgi:obg-like ATPase 1
MYFEIYYLTFPYETLFKDLEFIARRIEDIEKTLKRSNDKQLKLELECCKKVLQKITFLCRLYFVFYGHSSYGYAHECLLFQLEETLKDGQDVRLGDWKAAEIEFLNGFQLLSAKPVVYLVRHIYF